MAIAREWRKVVQCRAQTCQKPVQEAASRDEHGGSVGRDGTRWTRSLSLASRLARRLGGRSAHRADRRNKTEVVVRWAAENRERVWEPGERGRLEAQGSVRKEGGARGKG